MVSRSPAITYLTVTRAVSAIVKLLVFLVRKKSRQLYLLGDLDKEDEDSENKRVVQDADSADDNVDDLECEDPDVCKMDVCFMVMVVVVVVVVVFPRAGCVARITRQ